MFDRVFRELAKKYHLDERIIREVCNSPFRFASDRMKNADLKPIRFKYLFKVKPKTNCIKRLQDEQSESSK